jgi:hypothetical protein
MEAGLIRKGNLDLLAQSTWLMMHGVTAGLVCSADCSFVDRERLSEHSLARIVGSLQ